MAITNKLPEGLGEDQKKFLDAAPVGNFFILKDPMNNTLVLIKNEQGYTLIDASSLEAIVRDFFTSAHYPHPASVAAPVVAPTVDLKRLQ